jgi:hypothetical protein
VTLVAGQLYVLPFWAHPPGYLLVEWLKVSDRSLGYHLVSLN